jgi:dTDP-4-amino-4,6-dideoxygalactose transaminase
MQKVKYLDFSEEYKQRGTSYIKAIDRVFRSGIYILGPEVENFETEFSKFIGVKSCIGVANGLEAIQISLMALGIKAGDEIITTPISAVATTLAILAVGATPVFVDVDENGQIDVDLIEKSLTKKTKAVLPVHLYGQPIDIVKLKKICKKYRLFLIEDAAQAHGSKFRGKTVGTFGDIACYSFYPTKNLGAIGDGGAIVTNNKKLAQICREIRDYGQKGKYIHSKYGLNSRLDELQAAILSQKLKYLESDNQKRREIAKRYQKNLINIKKIKIILPENTNDSNFHLFVIRTKERSGLKDFLFKNGIPSLIHYPVTIPDQPMFKDKYEKLNIPMARSLIGEVLSLPCNPFIKPSEVDYISAKIKEFFK